MARLLRSSTYPIRNIGKGKKFFVLCRLGRRLRAFGCTENPVFSGLKAFFKLKYWGALKTERFLLDSRVSFLSTFLSRVSPACKTRTSLCGVRFLFIGAKRIFIFIDTSTVEGFGVPGRAVFCACVWGGAFARYGLKYMCPQAHDMFWLKAGYAFAVATS